MARGDAPAEPRCATHQSASPTVRPAVEQIHREKECSTRNSLAAIVRHKRIMPNLEERRNALCSRSWAALPMWSATLIRTRTGEGRSRAKAQGPQTGGPPALHSDTAERGQPTPRGGRYARRTGPQLQRWHIHHSPRDTRRMSSATRACLLSV